MACDLYCCLPPQFEALRTCRSGFPITTKPMNDIEHDLTSTSDDVSPAPILRTSGRKRRPPDRHGESVVYTWLLPIVRHVYLLLIMAESVCNCTCVLFTWGDCRNCVIFTG